MEQQGVYERINGRVRQLKEESGDPFFTEYLMKLEGRLIQEKYQMDLLEMELDRNCQMYRQRQAALEAAARNRPGQGEHIQGMARNPSAMDMQQNQTAAAVNAQASQTMPAENAEANHAVPTVNAEANHAVPAVNAEANHAVPAVNAEANHAVPAVDSQSNQLAPTVDTQNNRAMPAVAAEANHIMPAVDTQASQTMPAVEAQEEQKVPAIDTQKEAQTVFGTGVQEAAQAAPSMGMQTDARAVNPQSMTQRAAQPGIGRSQGTYTGSISQQPVFSQMYVQPPRPAGAQAASQPRKNHEFTIGINVFGTIGVLFVLAALILLGINYMSSLVKELGLYVLGLLVWGVAEFVIKKKSQTLSMILSSLGIGSLYVTTMVNFLYLHNFNVLATILITTLITVVVMIVSRKKDAGILRIICIGACMVSFLVMDTLHMVSDVELLIYMVMILMVQLLGIFLPVKKWAYGIAISQMAGAAIFAWIFAISTIPPEQVMELRALYVIGFVVLSMLLMELTVWRMPAEDQGQMQGICVTFGIGTLLLLWAHYQCAVGMFEWCHGPYSDIEIWIRLGVMAAITAMGILFFFLTKNKGYLRWMQGYFVAGSALLMLGCGSDEQLSVTITLSILVILYKLLAYRQKPLWAADAVITAWTALAALVYYDSVYGYVLLGVLLLSILLMNHWQTYFELLLTGTVILYISMAVDNDLMLPLTIAVMWLATLLFNYVKRFAGKGIWGFNMTMLVIEVSGYLGLIFSPKYDSVVIYLILTVLGLGIILFTFQPKFLRRAEGWRGLVVAGFLTYMLLVTRFEYRITSSILMMVVGLLGIIFGFRQTDRKLRIYGLVLCLLMCFKITLFDFRVQSLQRIILFLAAGVVALVISGVYALMEKKYNRENVSLDTQGRE